MNPIRHLQDWSAVKRFKEKLKAELATTPPPNQVAIPDADPIYVRAAMALVKEFPNLIRFFKGKGTLYLSRVADLRAAMRPAEWDRQARAGMIVGPDDLPREEEDFRLRLQASAFGGKKKE